MWYETLEPVGKFLEQHFVATLLVVVGVVLLAPYVRRKLAISIERDEKLNENISEITEIRKDTRDIVAHQVKILNRVEVIGGQVDTNTKEISLMASKVNEICIDCKNEQPQSDV